MCLTVPFTLFGLWRLVRRPKDPIVPTPEEFRAYPHSSPEIYGWAPHQKDTPGDTAVAAGLASQEPREPERTREPEGGV
ncbi:MAG: hypothetical protein U1F35_19515 [Steroidobacteraceae bacterium]